MFGRRPRGESERKILLELLIQNPPRLSLKNAFLLPALLVLQHVNSLHKADENDPLSLCDSGAGI